jgi:hypothetical protein
MKYLFSLFIFIFVQNSICAQQDVTLNELSTPATPAFTILGLSPTDISRPTLSKSFLFSLANGLNSSGNIASNVAIETTPFWWKSHPGLTYKKYYGMDQSALPSIGNQIIRSFSLSFATADASPDTDTNARLISGGFRFQLLNGKPSKDFEASYLKITHKVLIDNILEDLNDQLEDTEISSVQQLKEKLQTTPMAFINTNSSYHNSSQAEKEKLAKQIGDYFLDAVNSNLENDAPAAQIEAFLKEQTKNVEDSIVRQITEMSELSRVGWLCEFAGAGSLLAPTNKIDFTYGDRWGFWATLTYRFDAPPGSHKNNDFNLMGRVSGDFTVNNAFNRDAGLSWALSGESYNLTVEGIYRYYDAALSTDDSRVVGNENANTWRLAIAYQQKFGDNISLSLSVGKDYDNSVLTGGGLFSLANLNFTLPTKQLLKF